MTKAKTFYIGERINPQLKKSYYIGYGAISKTDALKKENCAYGSMIVRDYPDKKSYENEIEKLRADGFTVNTDRHLISINWF